MNNFSNPRNRVIEHLPMTGSQKWLMGEMHKIKHPGWTTIEFLTKTKVSMDEEAMEKAIFFLLEKYETLRVKFANKNGEWVQELYPLSEAEAFATYDFTGEDNTIQMEKLKQICIKTRLWLLPQRGNLLRIIFFKFSETEGRIWICMHHVISDFVSTLLLSSEFMNAYHTIVQGKDLRPQRVKDYRQWLYVVEGYSRDVLLPSELEYWISRPWDKAKIPPSDYPKKFHKEEIIIDAIQHKKITNSYRTKTYEMSQEDTLKLISQKGTDLENILLAIFFLAVSNHMKIDWLDINVSYSGRNILPQDYGVNANRVLGFLAAVRAVLLNNPLSGDLGKDIDDVVEQIKAIPNGGIGFNLIRPHINDEQLREAYYKFRKQPEILFNYMGRSDAMVTHEQYEMVDEDTGYNLYSREIKNTLLEYAVGVKQNQLFLEVSFSDEYFEVNTIDQMMHAIMDILQNNIITATTSVAEKNGFNLLAVS